MTDSFPLSRPLAPALPAAAGLVFGVPEVDEWLKGGLRRDGVHELYAAPDAEPAAAMALALLLGTRLCGEAGRGGR